MIKKSKIRMSSNRNFGLTFFIVFLCLGLWPLTNDESIIIWSIIISLIFLFLGLTNSKLLTPPNILWFKFGMFLGAIFAPIAMGAVFFLVVTPIGLIMRLLGKDILKKKYNKKEKSYWIQRNKPASTMKKQF